MNQPPPATPTITIRPALADDEKALTRLAALDSAVVPASPHLVVEVDDELRVAMSMHDGTVIADPFYPTLDLIALLRARRTRTVSGRQLRLRLGALRFGLEHG